MFRLIVVLVLGLLGSVTYAEVLELEGKVKAVDADARTISIERKTAKGPKTHDLEVTKKAGDLSSVEIGDKITFSYDPDLELVTKIVTSAGGNGSGRSTATQDDAIAKAAAELQGEWLMVAGEENGEKFERSDVKRQNRRLMIKGKSLSMERVKGNIAKWTGTFTLNPESKAFDWTGTDTKGTETKWIGIYSVEGDTLKLCFRFNIDGNAQRPNTFSSKDFVTPNATAFYTFKRDD